ncbi:MAG: PTS sugar transporter subunit IIA [Acidobacteriota bacterium]
MVSIPELLDPREIFLDLGGTDGPTVLRALADALTRDALIEGPAATATLPVSAATESAGGALQEHPPQPGSEQSSGISGTHPSEPAQSGAAAPEAAGAASPRESTLALQDGDELYRRLLEREKLGSTGIGSGVAVPHCKLGGAEQVLLALAVTRRSIDFASLDGQPVRVFFVVISPEDQPAVHLHTLAAISRWVQQEGNVEALLRASSVEAVLRHFGVPGQRDQQATPTAASSASEASRGAPSAQGSGDPLSAENPPTTPGARRPQSTR